MKNLFVFLTVATLLASCNSRTTETEVTTTDSTSVAVDTSKVDSFAAHVDTTVTK